MNVDAVLTRFGRWASRLRLRDVPEASLTAARWQLLDMVAAVHAAAASGETRSLAPGRAGFSLDAGRSTALCDGSKLAPHDAALDNAAHSMAQDYDDIVWMGHTCHSAVFASLAVAEHEGAGAGDLLLAIVVANELGGRLGASAMLGPLNGQMWTFIHCLGAAAATAKILGLDERAATHALAISLAQPSFALQPGFMTPSSKLLAAATPTACGIQAAYFARAGMTGAPEIVEDRRGFWSRFSYLPLPTMLDGLGEQWTIQTLAVKTYPGCHYFQTACAALERLLATIDAADVEAVHIDTTKLAIEATRFAAEYAAAHGAVTPVNVNFDLRVTSAILLLAGRLTAAETHPEWLEEHSQAIRRLAARVTVSHAPELTLRTLESIAGWSGGRAALGSITPGDVLRLVARYRREYRSSLVGPAELAGWLRAAGKAWRGGRLARRGSDASALPLYFPSRVTVRLRDGSEHTERVDLPPGSFCADTGLASLRAKVLREVTPRLGLERAEALLERGLALSPGQPLEPFVELIAERRAEA